MTLPLPPITSTTVPTGDKDTTSQDSILQEIVFFGDVDNTYNSFTSESSSLVKNKWYCRMDASSKWCDMDMMTCCKKSLVIIILNTSNGGDVICSLMCRQIYNSNRNTADDDKN